ncbi:MAG: TonB-dependent receptor [Myxococcales bacterium]|nr:TonB-dependent receptor [Myxococcales bacterium]
MPADVIDQIEFYPGNFSTRYGRFTGGILNAQIRGLDEESVRGVVDVSLLDASLLLEVPISKELSVLAAGRRSYIDTILGAAIGDETVSLTTAPRYYDFQAIVDWHPSRVHRFKLTVIGSDDQLVATFESPADIDVRLRSGNTNVSTTFGRAIASYQFTPSEEVANRLSFSAGFDQFGGAFGGQFDFDFDTVRFDVRNDFRWQIASTVELVSGLDAFVSTTDYSVLATRPPREGDPVPPGDIGDPLFSEATGVEDLRIAPFLEVDWRLFDRVSIIPGARLDYFSRLDALTFDPRVVFATTGARSSRPRAELPWSTSSPPCKNSTLSSVTLSSSLSAPFNTLSVKNGDPLEYLSFDVTLFYKDIQNLVSATGATQTDENSVVSPLVYDNDGTGEVFGLETFIEHKFNNNLRGWLSYTLSTARRTDSGETRSRFFDFDQTHIFSVVGSYLLPDNWEFGVRYRLVSGNPYTPFTGGIFVSERDEFEPITARVNSERLPTFHQIDLRVDKTWVYRTWQLSFYLSLTNAYNQSNVEAISYNYDFTQQGETTGLPILPILGVRAEF